VRARRTATLALLLALAATAVAQDDARDREGQQDRVEASPASTDSLAAAAADTSLGLEARILAIDAMLAAEADSLRAEGHSPAVIEDHLEKRRERLIDAAESEFMAASGTTVPLFFDCENTPEAGVQADVTKVNYKGRWANKVKVRGGGTIRNDFGIGFDTYRRQDKEVETRRFAFDYASGQGLPVQLSATASIDWSEDVTTNAGGNTNINAKNLRRAGLSASKSAVKTGLVNHNFNAGGFLNDQDAVNQEQVNDFREGELNGAWRAGMPLAEGVNLAARVYGIWRDGDSNLAGFESPSSTTGDTLGAGTYYKRSLMQGAVTVTQSSFDRRYLDYRRNSNGLIDTTNVPPGASKVVQELEEKDALDLRWNNTLQAGRLKLVSNLQHSFDRQRFRESAVGTRDRSEDVVELKLTVPAGADSFGVEYNYNWYWDDQTYADAAQARGKQYKKAREFVFEWFRDLFRNTSLSARFRTELTQDIAEFVDGVPFNENDRDRLTEEARLKVDTAWPRTARISLLLEYQSIDDIAIRQTRSANNNTRRTYTVSPNYQLDLGPRVTFSQVFRMYIQYQDYTFADLPNVNKEDTFNKRANVGSSLTWEPSDRLFVDIKHDYNQRFNGTRVATDAAGNAFYRRDVNQYINRIELGLTWQTTEWLELASATYRTKDTLERLGTTTTIDDRYSGELWIGGIIDYKWGPSTSPLVLKASIKRFLAYGPNVTETSADYWKADVLLKWTF
jgi:hypothetical protein